MLQRSRILAVATLTALLILFFGLGARLFVLQILFPTEYCERASLFKFKPVTVQVPRGTIYDIRGEVLAASVPAIEVWAATEYVDKPWTRNKDEKEESAKILARLLDLDYSWVLDRLGSTGYRCIKKKVTDPDLVARLYKLKEKRYLRGIDLIKTHTRYYPQGELLGHTLGFVNHEGQGVFGVECLQDALLKGRSGSRVYLRDAVQNEIFTHDEEVEPGLPGGNVTLTIDASIQLFAELELMRIRHRLQPKWAAAIVMEPCTGRILAAASIPSLNPEDPSGPACETSPSVSHWMNRVFKAEYTPGSSFKPLIMAMALNQGKISLTEEIDCEGGAYRIGGRTVTDTHVNYRWLDPAGVLIKSSNIGMSKIVLRLVPDDTPKGGDAFQPIWNKLNLLGFGRYPGIFDKDYETPGKVTDPAKWTSTYTLVSLSFGNEIAVSPIQMASAFSVLANNGLYAPPRLIERMEAPSGSVIDFPASPAYRVFPESVCRDVREMLVRVVEEGSGKRARLPGIQVAGKTGTAEKLPQREEVTSSFIAFAPADKPALLVLVVVDEPQGMHYASQVAAPHVKTILERGLAHLGVIAQLDTCAAWQEEGSDERL